MDKSNSDKILLHAKTGEGIKKMSVRMRIQESKIKMVFDKPVYALTFDKEDAFRLTMRLLEKLYKLT